MSFIISTATFFNSSSSHLVERTLFGKPFVDQ